MPMSYERAPTLSGFLVGKPVGRASTPRPLEPRAGRPGHPRRGGVAYPQRAVVEFGFVPRIFFDVVENTIKSTPVFGPGGRRLLTSPAAAPRFAALKRSITTDLGSRLP